MRGIVGRVLWKELFCGRTRWLVGFGDSASSYEREET